MQTNDTQKVALKTVEKNKHKTNAKRQAEPGLVAFYDIWPRNRAYLFLQPQNPHGTLPR